MQEVLKTKVGQALANIIQSNWLVGVGTGSTVSVAITEIARRIKSDNLSLTFTTTSYDSAAMLTELGLHVIDPTTVSKIDFGFDGVDCVTQDLQVIKGKGAAMLKEKIMAVKCKQYVYIADQSKIVSNLNNQIIPVEVFPEAKSIAQSELMKLGADSVGLRKGTGKFGAVVTEYGNLVLDCIFSKVDRDLEGNIKKIVGVVESGLFTSYASMALVAYSDRIQTINAN